MQQQSDTMVLSNKSRTTTTTTIIQFFILLKNSLNLVQPTDCDFFVGFTQSSLARSKITNWYL
jgi:hypothetical protein